jgi:hypothetical protein
MRTIKNETQKAIADAIRLKTGKSNAMTTEQMPNEILSIPENVEIETYVWEQSPILTKNFINNTIYNPNDRTTTEITKYAPASVVVSNYKPVGKTITIEDGILHTKDGEETVSAGNKNLINIIPNEDHYFSVENNNEVVQAGIFTPKDCHLRWIDCPKAINVRDLGGWSCNGGKIKYNKLIRSGEIFYQDRDVFVGQCGVTAELDLQDQGVDYTSSPLGDDIVYCRPPKGLYYLFDETSRDTWKEALEFVFDCISAGGTVLFHCTKGADRTGTVACILEGILGVSQSDIDKDYELTNFATGISGTSSDRLRTKTSWTELINSINALSIGNNFREKLINWVGSLGISIDKLNQFIEAMVDGTPEKVSYLFGNATITNSLTNVFSDNESTSVIKYQPYKAELTPATTSKYQNHKIIIGSKDVTQDYSYIKMNNFTEEVSDNYSIVVDIPYGKISNSLYIVAETSLPQQGYTLLESLAVLEDFTGYVDLQYVPKSNSGFSVTYKSMSTSSSNNNTAVFGNPDFAFGLQRNSGWRGYMGTQKSFQLTGLSAGDEKWHTVSINYKNDGVTKADGTSFEWNAGNMPTGFTESFKVFSAGSHTVLTQKAYFVQVSEVVITEGNNIIGTYKGAKDNNTGQLGFLRIEDETFYPSANSSVIDPNSSDAIMLIPEDDLL